MRSNPAHLDGSVHSAPRAGSDVGDVVSVEPAEAKVAAIRNLKRLQKTDPRVIPNDDFAARYMALRELRGDKCRISTEMLLSMTPTLEKTTALQQILWILPKRSRPTLDQEINAEFIVDPRRLESTPPGTSMADVWVVDQAVTQAQLGPGVWVWSTGVKAKFAVPLAVASETGQHQQSLDPAIHTSSSLGAQQPLSLLSDTQNQASDVHGVFESIARATKLAMENDRFVSPDIYDATTIEYWLRSFVSHLRKAKESFEADLRTVGESQNVPGFVDSQPPYVKLYLSFVAKCLLDSHCFTHLGKFLVHFVAIREFAPEIVPTVVHALEALVKDRPHVWHSTKRNT